MYFLLTLMEFLYKQRRVATEVVVEEKGSNLEQFLQSQGC